MIAQPFWITPRLSIVPRPRGGDWLPMEMEALAKAGVGAVVSLLTDGEAVELGLSREEEAAVQAGLNFVRFPIADREVPEDLGDFNALLARLGELMAAGCRVGIHCRACIGRSSVVAASLMIRSGVSAGRAWDKIEAARGFPVPDTPQQREWVDGTIRPVA